MNILLLDSSFDLLQFSLYKINSEREVSEIYYAANNSKLAKGEQSLALLDSILNKSNSSIKDVDVILFNRGPGSFVGTRIVTSIVQALVTVNSKIKVIATSSLEMVAQQYFYASKAQNIDALNESQSILVALDANMKEAYAAHFKVENGLLTLVGEEGILTAEQLLALNQYSLETSLEARKSLLDKSEGLGFLSLDSNKSLILLGNAWQKYCHNPNDLNSKIVDNSQVIGNYLYTEKLITIGDEVSNNLYTLLPDLRYLGNYILGFIYSDKTVYEDHFTIEPTYVRNNVAY